MYQSCQYHTASLPNPSATAPAVYNLQHSLTCMLCAPQRIEHAKQQCLHVQRVLLGPACSMAVPPRLRCCTEGVTITAQHAVTSSNAHAMQGVAHAR